MDSENYRGLWAMTWILGLKSSINPGVTGIGPRIKFPSLMHIHVVCASRGFQMHPCPYQGIIWGFNGLKSQWDPWVS